MQIDHIIYQNLGGLYTTFSNVFKYILLNGVQFSRNISLVGFHFTFNISLFID